MARRMPARPVPSAGDRGGTDVASRYSEAVCRPDARSAMVRRYDPFEEVFESWREFDDIVRRFFGGRQALPPVTGTRSLPPALPERAGFVPAVECFTRDRNLVFRVELPGVDSKDAEVCVLGNRLVIKGEKKEERKIEEEDLYLKEIVAGRFERSFDLPEGVKKDQVRAFFQNGVLEVTLPAPELEPARRVPIGTGETGKKAVKAA